MKIKIFLLFIVLSFFNIAFASDSEICEREFKDKNYTRALQYCEKACSQNDGLDCTSLGVLYAKGLGVKQDYKQAKNYFEKGCGQNNGEGCIMLGGLYDFGLGVKQNKKVSKEYYGKACDLGLQKGCEEYRKLNEQGY